MIRQLSICVAVSGIVASTGPASALRFVPSRQPVRRDSNLHYRTNPNAFEGQAATPSHSTDMTAAFDKVRAERNERFYKRWTVGNLKSARRGLTRMWMKKTINPLKWIGGALGMVESTAAFTASKVPLIAGWFGKDWRQATAWRQNEADRLVFEAKKPKMSANAQGRFRESYADTALDFEDFDLRRAARQGLASNDKVAARVGEILDQAQAPRSPAEIAEAARNGTNPLLMVEEQVLAAIKPKIRGMLEGRNTDLQAEDLIQIRDQLAGQNIRLTVEEIAREASIAGWSTPLGRAVGERTAAPRAEQPAGNPDANANPADEATRELQRELAEQQAQVSRAQRELTQQREQNRLLAEQNADMQAMAEANRNVAREFGEAVVGRSRPDAPAPPATPAGNPADATQ